MDDERRKARFDAWLAQPAAVAAAQARVRAGILRARARRAEQQADRMERRAATEALERACLWAGHAGAEMAPTAWARRPAVVGEARVYGARLPGGAWVTAVVWRVHRIDAVRMVWTVLQAGGRFDVQAALRVLVRRIEGGDCSAHMPVLFADGDAAAGLSVAAALRTLGGALARAAQGEPVCGGSLPQATARAIRECVAAGEPVIRFTLRRAS